ncbi:MAG: GNAT family N-acetyltransferase [Bacteroidia bacterium]|nr:GNAT family N-acetyltransferase [Bacteroidia bacterium]MDW8346801.1 GNAT family N-acetyltransferase [Bacteroidia bacterium]
MKIQEVILKNGQISFFDAFHIFRLRMEVFCTEQRCWYVDPDEYDFIATHILIYITDSDKFKQLAAYARVYQKDERYVISRVCTHLLFRKQGLGKRVMELALSHCPEGSTIYVQAQAYLKKFYEDFGFIQQNTNILWEDAVAHIPMIKVNIKK